MLTLDTPIQYVKGVGPALAKKLSKLNIFTISDIFYYFPRAYDDRRKIIKIKDIKEENQLALVVGHIISVNEIKKRNFSIIKAVISDNSSLVTLTWYNQPFLKKLLQDNTTLDTTKSPKKIFVKGKTTFNQYEKELQLNVQEFEFFNDEQDCFLSFGRVVPIYPLTEGLQQKKIRSIIYNIVDNQINLLKDIFPIELIKKYNLVDLHFAITNMHFPQNRSSWALAHRRLVFEEFFKFYLRVYCIKQKIIKQKGISFKFKNTLCEKYINSLPYQLTNAQQRVIKEIKEDMTSNEVMNRLLQGDVGSGKTEVAIAAILFAIANNYQTAIMVPTEVLAEQHFNKIRDRFQNMGLTAVLLVSNLSKKEKEKTLKDIKTGKTHVVVGTHALIQENVNFHNLGLVIIDEQHRFGVKQREAIKEKGQIPDLLVMTATPIPRSLALTLYGDLDKSVIDEMPLGRKPIKTSFIRVKENATSTKLKELYKFVEKNIKQKKQAYVVYPLIEETEKSDLKSATQNADFLQKTIFPNYKVGLLYSKMKKSDKDTVIQQFRKGIIDILVSTTVIEVGIDIPSTNIIIIENCERFGLSQLHQLRGRVGRGTQNSYCFLVGNPQTEEAKQRIDAMLKTTDGFKIAEYDLQIRGPGEFLGTRQSGLPEFKIANILKDEQHLLKAKEEVSKLAPLYRKKLMESFFPNDKINKQN